LESQKLQYAMQDRVRQLGWREIEVIDEDLGRSASGSVERSGFERMVAEVCMGKVGAVAAREVSRFARNSKDWQQLVEVCRIVDTLLIDQETVYAPRQSNDRLLLGLNRPDSQGPSCSTIAGIGSVRTVFVTSLSPLAASCQFVAPTDVAHVLCGETPTKCSPKTCLIQPCGDVAITVLACHFVNPRHGLRGRLEGTFSGSGSLGRRV